MYVALYVDDLLITGNCTNEMTKFKDSMKEVFDMKDLGEARLCIRIEIKRDWKINTISLSQEKYVKNVLKRYGMESCSTVKMPMDPGTKLDGLEGEELPECYPYRQLIGNLMYLSVCTRPDITFSVHKLSKYLSKP